MQARIVNEDNELFLQSDQGNRRSLPEGLYDKLSDISDAYDPEKEYIGYVDKVDGVVLVDVTTLSDLTTADEIPEQNNELFSLEDRKSNLSKKTMHQLAYEKKTGHPLPDDDARPISGFGIKKGKLLFNSSTFNAFTDEYHDERRAMGDVEKQKLQALLNSLNEESGKSITCCLL